MKSTHFGRIPQLLETGISSHEYSTEEKQKAFKRNASIRIKGSESILLGFGETTN